jgi:two-component system response regulator HydG
MMPGMSGADLLKAAKAVRPETEVVLITAYGTVETAVQAMKKGAYDFITKPLKRAAIVKVVRQAAEKAALIEENKALRERLAEFGAGGKRAIIGQSPAFRAVMDTLKQAAPSTATVLILGESGTGKEWWRGRSTTPRRAPKGRSCPSTARPSPRPSWRASCSATSAERFTGAIARKEGRFERASGGTLFLDEVGEMSPSVQVKLLRVLQEGESSGWAAPGPSRGDVRVVAATNKDLKALVDQGRFRDDLYYGSTW